MFWVIYYCITLLADAASLFIFGKYLSISAISLVPVCLIVLSAFQAIYFKKEKSDDGFSTAYGSELSPKEEMYLLSYASKTLLAGIPLLMPFIFFFPNIIKVLSLLVYIASFAAGGVYYRIKNKHKLQSYTLEEKRQLQEQIKKEEQGKWK